MSASPATSCASPDTGKRQRLCEVDASQAIPNSPGDHPLTQPDPVPAAAPAPPQPTAKVVDEFERLVDELDHVSEAVKLWNFHRDGALISEAEKELLSLNLIHLLLVKASAIDSHSRKDVARTRDPLHDIIDASRRLIGGLVSIEYARLKPGKKAPEDDEDD